MGCGTQIVPNFNEYNKVYKRDVKNPALEMKMNQLMLESARRKSQFKAGVISSNEYALSTKDIKYRRDNPDLIEDTNEYFHGTSTPIKDVGYSGGEKNIYGSGLYTTMNSGVAYKYTKKGKGTQPIVYKIIETNPGPSLNLETTPASFGKEMLGKEYDNEWFEGKSLREALDEYRDDSQGFGIPAWEVKEDIDTVFEKAYQQGYKSVTHYGGRLTGGVKHRVKIFTHPADDIKLKQVSNPK